MKKIWATIIGIVEVVIIAYVIFLTACLIFVNEYGYTQFGKYTIVEANRGEATLLDGVEIGDLLIIKNDNNIVKGQKIYYYSAINEQYYIKCAPVTDIIEDGFGAIYTLDIKNISETNTVNDKKVVGNEISIQRKLGKILETLESRTGFLFFVLLPIMCIFIYHVYGFIIILKFEDEEDIKYEKKHTEKEEII